MIRIDYFINIKNFLNIKSSSFYQNLPSENIENKI